MNIKFIPDGIKLLTSIIPFKIYEKRIAAAKNSGDIEREKKEIAEATFKWASGITKKFPMEIKVIGKENIPKEDGLVFISNHQGYADIIVMFIALEGKQIGFIAKDTLEKVPFIGKWVLIIRGLFIKRGNAKEALKSISEGSKLVNKGYNLVIFPEGTRSKGPDMAHFKAGSFKLATKAKAPIVPITINGSYNAFEAYGYAKPATIEIVIHPKVETQGLDRKELAELDNVVEDIIRSKLKGE